MLPNANNAHRRLLHMLAAGVAVPEARKTSMRMGKNRRSKRHAITSNPSRKTIPAIRIGSVKEPGLENALCIKSAVNRTNAAAPNNLNRASRMAKRSK